MFATYSLVIYLLIAVASATSPIMVSECGTLETPYATYQLANDIAISDKSEEFICFDIKGNGITLDGTGFGLSSAFNEQMRGTGVQYSGVGTTVKNMRIADFRTGIRAVGNHGKVEHNTITRAINGIDVTATNNDISNNVIGNFNVDDESTSGIYVYFPARDPVASFINITNNVISDIRGDSFVLGISVYFATAVYVANNRIFNLVAGVSKEEISVIQGHAELYGNHFNAPAVEASLPSTTFLLSCVIVLASALWFFREPTPAPTPVSSVSLPNNTEEMEKEKEGEKEIEKEKEEKKKEEEEFEPDGADMVKSTLSFSVDASPPAQSLSL